MTKYYKVEMENKEGTIGFEYVAVNNPQNTDYAKNTAEHRARRLDKTMNVKSVVEVTESMFNRVRKNQGFHVA